MIPNVVRGNGFRGALNYIFDTVAVSQGWSEKQPELIASNMAGQTPRDLAREFGVVRSLKAKAKNPVWHVSLSFAIGECPTDELLAGIPALFMNKVGAQARDGEIGINSEQNQWVAVAHHDKDHFHVHLVVNRINYDGTVCYCKWDKNRSQQACREIEQELGLVPVHGNSGRLFLEGRLVARLEAVAAQTGVVDPRLEQYRRERAARWQEIHEQQSDRPSDQPSNRTSDRTSDRTDWVRAPTGSVSQRDPVGVAGAATGSPDAMVPGATSSTAGLEWFKQQCERDFNAVLKRVLAALDPAGEPVRAGEPDITTSDAAIAAIVTPPPGQSVAPAVIPPPGLPVPVPPPRLSLAQLQQEVDQYAPTLIRLLQQQGVRHEQGGYVYEDERCQIVLRERVLSLVQKSDATLLLQAEYQDNCLKARPSQGLPESYRQALARWEAQVRIQESQATLQTQQRPTHGSDPGR